MEISNYNHPSNCREKPGVKIRQDYRLTGHDGGSTPLMTRLRQFSG
jgi:hypothetical protein